MEAKQQQIAPTFPATLKRVALVMDLLELAQQMVLPQLRSMPVAGVTRIGEQRPCIAWTQAIVQAVDFWARV